MFDGCCHVATIMLRILLYEPESAAIRLLILLDLSASDAVLHMSTSVHAQVCTSVHRCAQVCTCVHTHVQTCALMCTCVHICAHTCASLCTRCPKGLKSLRQGRVLVGCLMDVAMLLPFCSVFCYMNPSLLPFCSLFC